MPVVKHVYALSLFLLSFLIDCLLLLLCLHYGFFSHVCYSLNAILLLYCGMSRSHCFIFVLQILGDRDARRWLPL